MPDTATGRPALVTGRTDRVAIDRIDAPAEPARPRGRGRPPGRSHLTLVVSESYLRHEYLTRRRSSVELAVELGCSHKTVLRYLDLYGIPARQRGQRRARFPELHSVSFLHASHVVEGRSPADIAAELGCSRSAVVAALRTAGLSSRAGSGSAQLTAEYLTAAYVGEGRSTLEIAAEVGCGPATVARHLRRYGIEMRGRGGLGRRDRSMTGPLLPVGPEMQPVRMGRVRADSARDG